MLVNIINGKRYELKFCCQTNVYKQCIMYICNNSTYNSIWEHMIYTSRIISILNINLNIILFEVETLRLIYLIELILIKRT